MSKLGRALAGGVVGLVAVAAVMGRGSTAGASAGAVPPATAVALDPIADIEDVYAWMAGSNIELVMDLSPGDDGNHPFRPDVMYAFHLTSKTGTGLTASDGTETRVIVQFASGTSVQAWVTDAAGAMVKDYVTGDPSSPAGVTSTRGKIRLFAGRRSDPRFFNRTGVTAALATLGAPLATEPKTLAGCPTSFTTPTDPQTMRNQITSGGDAFAGTNVMAIVVQLDKALVNTGTNTAVSVWGSSHAAR